MDVYPVYRRLVERGVSVKCIKKPGKCSETGRDCLEVLRVGFPWWAEDSRIDESVKILSEVVTECLTAHASEDAA
jgi:hypothetical protein